MLLGMPEGHTIHRLARDLARDLQGHAVAAETRQPERFAEGAAAIDGRVLAGTEAWGKHLFLHWAPGDAGGPETLHVHLGLFGKLKRRTLPAPEPSPNLRVRLTGPEQAWDLTGAITSDVRAPEVVDEVAAKLGPDPLRRDADPGRFVTKLRRSRRPVGDLLLDQAVIAGVGNVYRAEILHLLRIHPRRPGRDVTEAEALAIWGLAAELLRDGVKRNRIVTVPADQRPPGRIRRKDAVHVYRRTWCRTCGSPVEVEEIGGRTSHACGLCQR